MVLPADSNFARTCPGHDLKVFNLYCNYPCSGCTWFATQQFHIINMPLHLMRLLLCHALTTLQLISRPTCTMSPYVKQFGLSTNVNCVDVNEALGSQRSCR